MIISISPMGRKKIKSKILERNIILYMGVQGGKEKSLQHPVFPGGHPSKY